MKKIALLGILGFALLVVAVSRATDTTLAYLVQPLSLAATNTVAVVTGPNTITYEAVPNSALAHPFSTSGFYLTNGTTYYVGPTFQPATLPVAGNFTWANQGSASVTANNNALTLVNFQSSSESFPLQYVAYSGTKTLTAAISAFYQFANSSTYGGCLIGATNGTVLVSFGPTGNGFVSASALAIYQWANQTTKSSLLNSVYGNSFNPYWLRIYDDGRFLNFEVSADGQNWFTTYSNTYGGLGFSGSPGNYFWGAPTNASNTVSTCTLLSWQVQ